MQTNGTNAAQQTMPRHWQVKAISERSFEVLDMQGVRVATYPSAELAHKVRRDLERKEVRKYAQAMRKAAHQQVAA